MNWRGWEITSRCSLGGLNVAFKFILCTVLRMAGLCFESNTPGLSLAFSQLPVQEEGGGEKRENSSVAEQKRSRAVQIKDHDWHRLQRG